MFTRRFFELPEKIIEYIIDNNFSPRVLYQTWSDVIKLAKKIKSKSNSIVFRMEKKYYFSFLEKKRNLSNNLLKAN